MDFDGEKRRAFAKKEAITKTEVQRGEEEKFSQLTMFAVAGCQRLLRSKWLETMTL